jgi:hypothetical protein
MLLSERNPSEHIFVLFLGVRHMNHDCGMTPGDILFIQIFLQIVQVCYEKIGRKITVTTQRRKHNTRTDIVSLAFLLLGLQNPS